MRPKFVIGGAIMSIVALGAAARTDTLIFTYEGHVLPIPDGGLIGDECESVCTQGVAQGSFFIQWPEIFGEFIDIGRYIVQQPDPEPETFWIEWRFRSDLPLPPNDAGCDGYVQVQYGQVVDRVDLHGNAAVSFNGVDAVVGLPLNEFYTVRFESRDGINYTFSVDGKVFQKELDEPPDLGTTLIQFGGRAICNRPDDVTVRNEWDFVRCGTIADGETITESDPPSGIVDASQYPVLDRFTVTFDEPAFVYIDQIDVTTTSGDVPQVLWTKRLDNGPPNVVQIVLDRPLPLNATTTFTFDDGVATSVVEYTYVELGACCGSDGTCVGGIQEPDCTPDGGLFVVGESCGQTQACCFDGQCAELAPTCCLAMNGTPASAASASRPHIPSLEGLDAIDNRQSTFANSCEGDTDSDGTDGVCGDQCPMDENKLAPGVCGCGVADIDSDGDTVADCLDLCRGQDDLLDSDGDTIPDCVDQCAGEDDRIDEDENGVPDCAQFQPIPTASTWGLATLALLLLIAAKLRRIGDCRLSIVDCRKARLLSAVLTLGCGLAETDAAIKYVKPISSGSGDCSTWANACTLPTAISGASSGDEIWVKSGTYAPFALKNAVKIIGGFAGTESTASQSNPTANATIVDGNDQYQCITGDGEGTTTVLRGFTIKNCAISGTDFIGAGLYLKDSSARIAQCIFEENAAQYFGAAVGIQGAGAPEFVNCIFRSNGAGSGTSAQPYGGGAVWVHSGNAKFTNCLFHDNIAGEAGALGALLGTVTLVNCTFAQNTAGFGSGGAILDPGQQITIQNSILWDNDAARDGDQIYSGGGVTTTVTYSNIEGGWTGTGNINSDPLFVNAGNNDFKIPDNSPCKDVGSNSLLPADVADIDWDTNTTEALPKDLAGTNRKIEFTVDMGCFEGPVTQ